MGIKNETVIRCENENCEESVTMLKVMLEEEQFEEALEAYGYERIKEKLYCKYCKQKINYSSIVE